jgi:hypothetical protein
VLLCLWSPLPDSSLAGQEHGRTIPLVDIGLHTLSVPNRPVQKPFRCANFQFGWIFALKTKNLL